MALIARRVFQIGCLLALASATARAGSSVHVAPQDEASADLSVSVVSSSSQTGSQHGVTFDVMVINYGPVPAPGVLLEAVIDPTSLDKIERMLMEPPPGASCDAKTLTCLLGDLGGAEEVTLRMLVHVPADLGPIGVGIEFRVSSGVRDTQPRDNYFFSSEYVEARKEGGSGPVGLVSVALLAWFILRCKGFRIVQLSCSFSSPRYSAHGVPEAPAASRK